MGGRCSRAAGMDRFRAGMAAERGGFAPRAPIRPLSRRSGRFPALPYPPLR